ncbi:hypothetical protein DFW101_2316 [Solidesulfovibrio carbinoliphilus subsp. oakridgensis]|uniref:Uncharacterized protein n=1 Tax=Solidesulfovibrio carbinoliphilus subsp. oakridgensis TaxID=694327 RepID=G7QAY0_9BACT|nr:hypothetical protein DFW101_2316 [Solidesulfovibrio carbinoliphilus subsp. oakridgensis]
MSGAGGSSFPRDGWNSGQGGAPGGEGSNSSSGGSGGSSGGGGSGGGGNICSSLFERTILSSPVPEVITKLKQGGILQIELIDQGRILAASFHGERAGSIISPKLIEFIECIQAGFEYIATVDAVDGGQCQVTIRPKVKK